MKAVSFKRSAELFERSRAVIPGGVTSSMRAFQKPTPIFIDRGVGSRLYDVDGNEYIDYALAHGPLILGHCHPRIVEAVERQMRRGSAYGCQHELEPVVAERILEVLPWASKVIFSCTGTEAIQVALRVARAATGRTLIVKFEGHYHGWADSVLIGHRHQRPVTACSNSRELMSGSGQSASVLNDILVIPWNDEASLQTTFDRHGDRIAALIAEPVQVNTASILPKPGFLHLLRDITRRHRAALIFDEVITGFRLAPGGASEHFGVTPDLAVFAKAIAGGYPLSAVAGTQAAMSPLENDSVRHVGTFNANPIVMAAAAATLTILLDPAEGIYGRMKQNGERLFRGLQALSSDSAPIAVQGLPVCFHTLFTAGPGIATYADFLAYDQRRVEAWQRVALAEGIFQMGDARWYISGVHSEEDVSRTLEKTGRALQRLALNSEYGALAMR
ncbi:MAG: aspartate aminotransferase family protein [Bryobacteraceae bacterium]